MEPEKVLDLGSKYSKKDLSSLLDQPNLSFVREGIFNCKNSSSSLFFVDLEKKDKERRKFASEQQVLNRLKRNLKTNNVKPNTGHPKPKPTPKSKHHPKNDHTTGHLQVPKFCLKI